MFTAAIAAVVRAIGFQTAVRNNPDTRTVW